MLDAKLRSAKDAVLRPVASVLHGRIQPVHLTLVGFAFGIAAAVSIALEFVLLAFLLWLLNRVIDGVDGTVARWSGTQSDAGGYIDMMCDVTVYAALAVALAVGRPAVVWIAAGVLLASFYINITSWTLLSAIVEKRRHQAKSPPRVTSMHMQAGLLEGTETMIFYSMLILFPQLRFVLMLIMAAAALVSTVQRLIFVHRNM